MKLLLINPTERKMPRANLPQPIEELRGKNPPIGLLYVAAAARQVDGWRVELVDANAKRLSTKDVASIVQNSRPDLIGLTVNSFTYLDALDIARAAKQAWPAAKIIFGGIQPFIYPKETLSQPEVDIILVGEAEDALPKLLRLWLDKNSKELPEEAIKGIYYKGSDAPFYEPTDLIRELDAVPMPAWDASPLRVYSSLVTNLKPVTIMITSRGCPFKCRYCALSATGKMWRAHSPKRVVDEMKRCQELGIKYLLIYDEVFTIDKRRVIKICELINEERIDINWMARAVPGTVDYTTMLAMKEAGCDLLTFGVESGSERILENLGRKQDIKMVQQSFADAKRTGIRTIAYFMIGNPGETIEDFNKSKALAVQLDPDYVHASIFTPYPASEIYESAVRDGKMQDYWRDYALKPDRKFAPPYWKGEFSERELIRMLYQFYLKFSVRAKYIKRIISVPRRGGLFGLVRGAWNLIRLRLTD